MSLKFTRYLSVALMMLTTSFLNLVGQKHVNPYPGVLRSEVDSSTFVRFYYEPPIRDHYIYPLVLRVGTKDDPTMQDAPLQREGVTVRITLSEMKDLVTAIKDSIKMPLQSRRAEVLESFQFLPEIIGMDVVVILSEGSARGSIDPKDICERLGTLNTRIISERAVWQFELMRTQLGCPVPNFDSLKH